MPAEWAPHERTWMAWPTSGYTVGDTEAEAEEARQTWAAVANAIVAFEPVTMVVDPRDIDVAPRYLAAEVETLVAPLNDAWMRDIGPTFVVGDGPDGPRLGAVDWVFNGWGAQDWASWDLDRHIGRIVAEASGAERIPSELVNEGGGIHVDGTGTVLATTTVQLDPGRNPGLSPADVEAEFARTLGTTRTVWLPRGLTRDSQRFGTRGHVDIVAAFTESGALLVHEQPDESHPDAEVGREVVAALEQQGHADGTPFEIVRVPAPTVLRDEEGWVDYSYINHLVVNGGVIACSFGDGRDESAAQILADAYPGRTVVQVDARPLFARGGGIHCITQQQPAL
ncbi:MAG TPA: agmatine deiminase family protein [Plantibacter sp.]|uniref:agmatine deiminase family protein n=1 Tax=unclassified Plantibacter TaxID=2624265 RepID=UPI002B9442C6|nr:agmatine deiminase family protein [Plantibacter sp.]